jgi:hypothetical protein
MGVAEFSYEIGYRERQVKMPHIADSYEKAMDVLTVVLNMKENEDIGFEDMVSHIHDALLDARNYGYRQGYSEATKLAKKERSTMPGRFSDLPKTAQWAYKSWHKLLDNNEELERTEEDWQDFYKDYIARYKIRSVDHFVQDICRDVLHLGFVLDLRGKEVNRL